MGFPDFLGSGEVLMTRYPFFPPEPIVIWQIWPSFVLISLNSLKRFSFSFLILSGIHDLRVRGSLELFRFFEVAKASFFVSNLRKTVGFLASRLLKEIWGL